MVSALKNDDFINIGKLEVDSVGFVDLNILMEGGPQLQEFLGYIQLHVWVEILVEISVLFLAYFADLLGDNFLKLLWPCVILDLILSIDLDLVKLKQLFSGERLSSLEAIESLEKPWNDRVINRVIICRGQSPQDMDQLMVGDGS